LALGLWLHLWKRLIRWPTHVGAWNMAENFFQVLNWEKEFFHQIGGVLPKSREDLPNCCAVLCSYNIAACSGMPVKAVGKAADVNLCPNPEHTFATSFNFYSLRIYFLHPVLSTWQFSCLVVFFKRIWNALLFLCDPQRTAILRWTITHIP